MRFSEIKSIRKSLNNLKNIDNKTFEPLIFDLKEEAGRGALSEVIRANASLKISDTIDSQIKELLKIRNPSKKMGERELNDAYEEWKKDNDPLVYGLWVFYPWKDLLVHIVSREEFIELRTSRNKYKIIQEEQDELMKKKVGVIGLSVGQSVAVTMAIERSFGTIRLADFDHLELTNLNRIRRGIDTLGQSKTLMVAREIAEIDPFLKVELYDKGVDRESIEQFLSEGGKLDLLIEECDSLDIKILSRVKARELGIPVLMDTSDRGMIDIERFDIDSKRDILHGLVGQDHESILNSTGVDRVLALYKLAGGKNISSRLKASYLELEQSITTWPQLASSVALGGAVLGDVARKVLMGLPVSSGRFYVDIDELIPGSSGSEKYEPEAMNPLEEGSIENFLNVSGFPKMSTDNLPQQIMDLFIEAGCAAPSSGNDQPWLFVCHNGDIFVFHEMQRTFSFGDYNGIGSLQSIGAAIENIVQQANEKGYRCNIKYLINKTDNKNCIAQLGFTTSESKEGWKDLYPYIKPRITDRTICERKEIDSDKLLEMKNAAESIDGFKLKYIDSTADRNRIGEILAACDRVRLFHPQGHYDFFHREMRWTEEEAKEKRVGMNINELEIDSKMVPALRMLENYDVIRTLESVGGGKGFENISKDAADSASAFGLIYSHDQDDHTFMEAGRSWERMWLLATKYNISIHPMIAPVYIFSRIDSGEGLKEKNIKELTQLRKDFHEVFGLPASAKPLFLYRLFIGNKSPVKSYRLPREKVYFNLCKL